MVASMDYFKFFEGRYITVKTNIEYSHEDQNGDPVIGLLELTGYMIGKDDLHYYIGIIDDKNNGYITHIIPLHKVELIEVMSSADKMDSNDDSVIN